MKIVLSTLNAKYIHSSLALRLLYVANKEQHDIDFVEYTIKEDLEKVANELIATNSQIIGLGVYIWNVKQTKQLVKLLKDKNHDLIIILGGPEVTYEPDYFLSNWEVDYIISGEGEFVLGELLDSLKIGSSVDIEGVSSADNISNVVVKADLEKLATLQSPYMLEKDKEDMKNKLVYFESSRGCPYQCQYCLSSLEKGVRYFPKDYLLHNLKYLIDNGAKQIKFLDRTFNLNKEHTIQIFDFLIQNHRPNLSCQFEIYADLLDDIIINYLNENLPKNFFRFEIGIQSTYEPTNIAVKRKQNFPLLAANIIKLMNGKKLDLHLDLIAGLPHESYERFVDSFNHVFALSAKEVQLGFLKMLRGTNLRKEADKYGYKYNQEAPYEIECNANISRAELDRIHDAEHALEKYWNKGKFPLTMKTLCNGVYKEKYFQLFDEIGQYYLSLNLAHHAYQLEDTFRHLHNFLQSMNIDLSDALRSDYYSNFSIRPNGYWKNDMEKSIRKRLLYQIGQDKDFLKGNNLNRKIIEKQTAINPIAENEYILTVFLSGKRLSILYGTDI